MSGLCNDLFMKPNIVTISANSDYNQFALCLYVKYLSNENIMLSIASFVHKSPQTSEAEGFEPPASGLYFNAH